MKNKNLTAVIVDNIYKNVCISKDVDINEHETIQHYTWTQIKVRGCFYHCSTFHSHSKVFHYVHTSI